MLESTTTLYVSPLELAEICNHGEKEFILAIAQPFGQFSQAINIPLKQIIMAQHNGHEENNFSFAQEADLSDNDYVALKRNLSGAISNGMVYKIKRAAFAVLITKANR
jgi:hypothetical protein